jgi:hypothetical protein
MVLSRSCPPTLVAPTLHDRKLRVYYSPGGDVRYTTHLLIYPEGDTQEIEWSLSFNQIVDVSGRPLRLPLPTARMLAYRVFRVDTQDSRNEHAIRYSLEQLLPDDLAAYSQEVD